MATTTLKRKRTAIEVSNFLDAPKASTFQAEDYSYKVSWSEDDRVFIGKVIEFPSLAAHGDTPGGALEEIMNVVGIVLEDLEEEHQSPPPPLSKRHFSGKFNVRVSESLHRKLSVEAEAQGVSLNHFMTDLEKLKEVFLNQAERGTNSGEWPETECVVKQDGHQKVLEVPSLAVAFVFNRNGRFVGAFNWQE